MGVIYKVLCKECNTTFEHQAGNHFYCSCRDCGESQDEKAPFYCPVCHRRFEPQAPSFKEQLLESTFWD